MTFVGFKIAHVDFDVVKLSGPPYFTALCSGITASDSQSLSIPTQVEGLHDKLVVVHKAPVEEQVQYKP